MLRPHIPTTVWIAEQIVHGVVGCQLHVRCLDVNARLLFRDRDHFGVSESHQRPELPPGVGGVLIKQEGAECDGSQALANGLQFVLFKPHVQLNAQASAMRRASPDSSATDKFVLHLRPIVQRRWIEIRTVRPYERARLVIESDCVERCEFL